LQLAAKVSTAAEQLAARHPSVVARWAHAPAPSQVPLNAQKLPDSTVLAIHRLPGSVPPWATFEQVPKLPVTAQLLQSPVQALLQQ
jgi:hypothetical protein